MTEKKSKKISVNHAWEILFDRYNIVDEIKKNGIFYIKASDIKEVKEPRLMAKWDNSETLPSVMSKNKVNILSISRGSYALSDFLVYKELPNVEGRVININCDKLDDFETINLEELTSEAKAINVLSISGILDQFLETPPNTATFNGRMGTGKFDFYIDTASNEKKLVKVNNAQCEIDAGFENDESVVIMEAKNVIREDFNVRQLYYPYRLWKEKVNKPIRLVFSVYSNKIYRLYEYKFNDAEDYSSIELVKSKSYSLDDTKITINDLKKVRKETVVCNDDNQDKNKVPFIQADSFERVISLMESINYEPRTTEEIAEIMNFEKRQSDYYFNAGKYLGLFEKIDNIDDGEKKRIIVLTKLGKKVRNMNYKSRQLKLVSLILEHKVFADSFDYVIESGEIPDREFIKNKMRKYNVCSENLIDRRASSVSGWINWIFKLTKL